MKIDDVRRTAYSMPLTSPCFPRGPYRFFNREYFVITYRTDPEALAAVGALAVKVWPPTVTVELPVAPLLETVPVWRAATPSKPMLQSFVIFCLRAFAAGESPIASSASAAFGERVGS